ncbi:MAG: PQQ-binding-like beta-propeller repeat protein [Planctomycetes bacterium]|nr:PQQ-binding-like beta-propeller repeat protein [Planctomycetota bacterium]
MCRLSILIASLFLFTFHDAAQAEDWREFRGPTGQGHYSGKNLPIEWSVTKNVAWKQAIPGKGWSSPIVLNGRIYLTSAVPIPDSQDLSLQAMCLDAGKGNMIWNKEVFRQESGKAPRIHNKNSHASPTPITDGKRIYVHFGHQGTACLDLNGAILWSTQEHRYAPVHGNGGTPILVGNRLVFSTDGGDKQFVVALNTADGKVAWKTPRKNNVGQPFSFSTPLAMAVNGKIQIVSPASGAVMAYDADDGKEIWRARYAGGYSVIPRPVYGHGMVYIGTGYLSPTVLAVKVDGQGDVTDTHVAWVLKKGAPHTPSLLLVDNELYAVSDNGIASCVDARTGKVHYQERVPGGYSASPFFADGKIYLQNEGGVTTVLRAGTTFDILASSDVKERTFASYAVVDGAIFLRSETQLYRIQKK